MSTTFRVGFIGLGNMASAIIGGMLAKEVVCPSQICAYDVSSEKCAAFAEKGLIITKNEQDVVANSKYVFLCVKPQVMGDVLTALKPAAGEHNVFVSIAAGVGAQYIKNNIGFDCSLVLVMPNTPLMLGAGASALACIAPTNAEDFAFVKSIFASAGISEVIPADKLCEVIPVNGSSPAFIYLFAKVVADFAKEQGIDYNVALRLFAQTLIGSAKMLSESNLTPDELIKMVSSPGGTTLKALSTFEEYGFEKTVRAAMRSCIDRAYELGR